MVIQKLTKANRIAIYGAQMVGVSIYYAIKTLYKDIEVICFLVTDKEGNPAAIDSVPVIELDNYTGGNAVQILLALPEIHHADVANSLKKKQLNNYILIDSETESELMKMYYKKTGEFSVLCDYELGLQKSELAVYMSKCHKDKALTKDYPLPDWVYPIQAGAALADIRVADLGDNSGDNISAKNNNYCELTALYWVSRNRSAEYLGLIHYRRILDITEEDLYRFKQNEIDVILPYPTIQYPNIENHHKRYIKEKDWQVLLNVLEKKAPRYAHALPAVFSQKFFYNYNMLIARKDIFQDYCEWLFPILQCVEDESQPKGIERSDRYIGYLGESLLTLYFIYHKNDYKIVHTGRKMLI